MTQAPDEKDAELRRLHSQADALEARHPRHGRTRAPPGHADRAPAPRSRGTRRRAGRAAIGASRWPSTSSRTCERSATPSPLRELPERPGLELAAAFVPATEQVSGDFYLVAEGPQDATVLVIGDVVGHGLRAARRAAFIRTAFAATAPFTDDPWRLLSWANTALVERAGTSGDFVTAACMTYLPHQRLLRFAYAGHPPAVRMSDGGELIAPSQGVPLGVHAEPEYAEGTLRPAGPTGVLLYTDGLTEARHNGTFFGLRGVTTVLSRVRKPLPERGRRRPARTRRRVCRQRHAHRRPLHARRPHRLAQNGPAP